VTPQAGGSHTGDSEISIEIWKPELPGLLVTAFLVPFLTMWILGSGGIAGWLKLRQGLRTGDTRKLFHFSIFFLAIYVHASYGPAGVNLLGCLAAIYIGYCLLRGDGNPLYEAMARESDHPRRSLHILIPFLATAAGGICSLSLFGEHALFGFAICGIADAIAEPVGIRLGRHRYRSWNLPGCEASQRSLEGSLAVFVVSFAIAVLIQATTLNPLPPLSLTDSLLPAAVIATGATLVEGLSPHGTDNFTLQVAASGLAFTCANLSSAA
jgi:dolichol kinase